MSNYYEVAVEFRLKDTDTEICGQVQFDRDDENHMELTYKHVMTGSQCFTLQQVFQGWCEQDKKENKKWKKLVELINEFDDFDQFVGHDVNNPPIKWVFILSEDDNIQINEIDKI